MLRPLRDERIRRLRGVIAGRELAVAPDRDRADAHRLRPELLLPLRDVAVGAPGHADFLLAEQLEALPEADRRHVGVQVALLLEVGQSLVERSEEHTSELQ